MRSREQRQASADVGRRHHAHAFLVEQPVEQALGRQRRIEQLVVLHRRGQMARAVPVLVVVAFQAQVVRLALQLALAAFARKLLDHQAAGAPVRSARAAALGRAVVPRHRQADESRDLLGLAEIGVRRVTSGSLASATMP